MSPGLVDVSERRTKLPLTVLASFVSSLVVFAVAVLGFWLVARGVTSGNRIATSDPRYLHGFTGYRSAAVVATARVATWFGTVGVLVALGVVMAVALRRLGPRLAVATAPLAALLIAGCVTLLIKEVIGRPSPGGGRWHHAPATSFPSGHAADSSAFFVALAMVLAVTVLRHPLTRFAAVAVGFAIPAVIGVSRLVLGVHWPTDVLAGWGLGSAIAIATVLASLILRPAGLRVPWAGDRVDYLRSLALTDSFPA